MISRLAFERHIAPIELIREDFTNLKAAESLHTTPGIEDLLFVQSLEGRSHNGAGVFNKRTYVNTTDLTFTFVRTLAAKLLQELGESKP